LATPNPTPRVLKNNTSFPPPPQGISDEFIGLGSGRWWEMVGDGGRWWEMVGDGGRWWEISDKCPLKH